MHSIRSARGRGPAVGSVFLALLSACAGVSFDRTTETSGTFSSYGLAVTILSSDFPAIQGFVLLVTFFPDLALWVPRAAGLIKP